MQQKQIWQSIPTIVTIAALLVVSLALKSINFIIISISIWILFKMLYPKINKWVFDSKFFISILVFFCYIILLQCAVVISWIFDHNFSLSNTPFLLLIMILITYGYDLLIHNKNPDSTKTAIIKSFNLQDILSLIIVTIITGFILISPLVLNPGDTKSTLSIYLINGNVDDAAHLSLINDHIQFDRGVFLDSDATDNTRTSGFYPAGWHSVSAILIKTFCPNIKTGISSLWAYGIQKLFWFFILFYLFFRVTFTLFRFIINKSKIRSASLYWITASTTLLGGIFLLPIARDGFYSFFPQLIAALLSIPVILQICFEKDTSKTLRSMPIFLLILFGGCLSWILPLPAFSLAALAIIIWVSLDKNLDTTKRNILTFIKNNLVILFITGTAVITQIYIMISDKSEGAVSFIKGVALDGGITQYNDKFLLFVCIGLLCCIVLASKKAKKNIKLILALILSLLIYCVFIYLLQMASIGRTAYYFYKLLDILLAIAIPFCIVGSGLAIKKICNIGQGIPEKILATLIILASLLYIGIQISTLAYVGGYRDFPNNVSSSLYSEIKTEMTESNYGAKKHAFYFKPGADMDTFVQNEIANMIAKSNTQDSTCFNTIRLAIWKSPSIESLLTDIVKYCDGYSIDLVTDQANYSIFSQGVIDMGLQKTVTIKTY